jgi:hypothetical protein
MLVWKANLGSLVEETMALAQGVRADPTIPRSFVGPKPMPSVNWIESEREEILHRVANFKAHQQRFIREREDFAASEFKRMLIGRK